MNNDFHLNNKSKNDIKEICSLSNDQIGKIERVNDSFERRFNAEATKESQQKLRILFERTAKEWLPFIVYCLTFGPFAAISIWRIVSLEIWWQLVIALVALIIIMLVPALFMPWFRRKRNKKDEINYQQKQ